MTIQTPIIQINCGTVWIKFSGDNVLENYGPSGTANVSKSFSGIGCGGNASLIIEEDLDFKGQGNILQTTGGFYSPGIGTIINSIGCNKIQILSGNIITQGSSGIGSSFGSVENTGWLNTLEINGGFIQASVLPNTRGTGIGAGIGRGNNTGWVNSIIITDGIIDAKGSNYSAAIGSGSGSGLNSSWVNLIEISGGTINALGGSFGSGIGCGSGVQNYSSGVNLILITGGIINATGGSNGAGIGAGYGNGFNSSWVQSIMILNSVVTAKSSENGAGIGGAYGHESYSSWVGEIYIGYSNIDVQGGVDASGIGGGWGQNPGIGFKSWVGSITIEHSYVKVKRSYLARAERGYGSALGGGAGNQFNSSWVGLIHLKGGKLFAHIQNTPEYIENFGAVIGCGSGGQTEFAGGFSSYVREIIIEGNAEGTHDRSQIEYGSGLGAGYGRNSNSSFVEKMHLLNGKINVSGGKNASGLGAGYGRVSDSGRVDELIIGPMIKGITAHCDTPGHAIGNGANGIVHKYISFVNITCNEENTTCSYEAPPPTNPFSVANFWRVEKDLIIKLVILGQTFT